MSSQSDEPVRTATPHPEHVEAAAKATEADLLDAVWGRHMSMAARSDAMGDEGDAIARVYCLLEEIEPDVGELRSVVAALAVRAYRLLGYGAQNEAHALGHAALKAAIASDWEAVGKALSAAIDIDGGIYDCLMVWCDAYRLHATDGRPIQVAARVRIGHVDAQTGEMMEPDDPRLPQAHRWAGQLISARVRMDEKEFIACLDELQALPEGEPVGAYINSVLECVAGSIRMFPRGWTTMGGTGWPSTGGPEGG